MCCYVLTTHLNKINACVALDRFRISRTSPSCRSNKFTLTNEAIILFFYSIIIQNLFYYFILFYFWLSKLVQFHSSVRVFQRFQHLVELKCSCSSVTFALPCTSPWTILFNFLTDGRPNCSLKEKQHCWCSSYLQFCGSTMRCTYRLYVINALHA